MLNKLHILLSYLSTIHRGILVSCSQTIRMMVESLRSIHSLSTEALISEFFRLTFWRRIAECKEKKHWFSAISTDVQASDTYSTRMSSRSLYHLSKRKIFSLIIWVGTTSRFELMEQNQALVLENEQFDSYFNISSSDEYVVPYFSSEVTYSCRPQSTVCKGKNPKFVPKSDINRMPEGWGCAQRRPLRTLAHVLLLFDPQFILMVDDDTYVNYRLIMQRYRADIYGVMRHVPVVLGEFQGKEHHLTSKGIFAGGSGYLIGRAAIKRLISNSSMYYAPGDRHHFRTPEQQRSLSVVVEAFRKGATTCAEDCVDFNPLKHPPMRTHPPVGAIDMSWKNESGLLPDGFLKVAIRLVDLCANLMANEHTCLHSDHSLGRCLVYGANVVPVGMTCQREYQSPNMSIVNLFEGHRYNSTRSTIDNQGKVTSYVKVLDSYSSRPKHMRYSGMCFMTRSCNLSEHLTCHRYKASHKKNEDLMPVAEKVYNHNSYYRSESSCEIMMLGDGMNPLGWC